MVEKNHTHPEKESKSLEFKSIVPKFPALIKTCIAFANGVGGKIIIGVDDKTRKIIGFQEKERDRIYDDFSNSLYDSVCPTLIPQIYEKRFNDVSVLIIEISQSPKKPYFLKGEGIPKGVYVRIGTCTRRANQDYVEDLVREGNRVFFDEEPIRKDLNILSSELMEKFYGKQVSRKRLMADKIIDHSSANAEKFFPTVAGVVYFCEDPHLFLPEASVICTRFMGSEGRDIVQTKEFTGPIGSLADSCSKWTLNWLERNLKLEGMRLKGRSLIPKEALREAIINALIHRKYSIPGSIKIAIYDDRVEIFSPGCFPGLVDLDNLGDGTTYLRNPTIARMAHKMGLVEKLGSGVRMIFDSCRKYGLKAPLYSEGGDFVKVTFFFEHQKQPGTSDEDAIVALAKLHDNISARDVMDHLNISRNTASRKLSKLLASGVLIRMGKGPSTRYFLEESH